MGVRELVLAGPWGTEKPGSKFCHLGSPSESSPGPSLAPMRLPAIVTPCGAGLQGNGGSMVRWQEWKGGGLRGDKSPGGDQATEEL